MVLVDSTNPATEADPARQRLRRRLLRRRQAVFSTRRGGCTIGLVRLVGSFGYGDLPPQSRDEVRAATATAGYASGWIDEFVQANASGSRGCDAHAKATTRAILDVVSSVRNNQPLAK